MRRGSITDSRVRPRQYARPAPASPPSYNVFPVPQSDSNAARKATCAMARQERADTLERVGLKRTYDLLQRLDAMVREACKGL